MTKQNSPGKPLFFHFTWLQRIRYWVLALAVVGLLVLYGLELPYFDNTLGFRTLLGWSLGIGSLVGVLLGGLSWRAGKDAVEKIQLFLLVFVPVLVFSPLFGSLSNRLLGEREPRSMQVTFWKQEGHAFSRLGFIEGEPVEPDEYYLFFHQGGELVRVRKQTPFQVPTEQGDPFQLRVRKGAWGYPWVPFYE